MQCTFPLACAIALTTALQGERTHSHSHAGAGGSIEKSTMAAGDQTVASGVMATDLSREERLLKRSAAAVEEEDEASAEPTAKRQNTGAEPSGAGRARAGQGAAVASDDHAEGAKGVETGAGTGEGGAGENVGATATAAPDEEQQKQAVVGAQATASEAGGDKADACGASQRPPAPASSSGAGASAPEAPAVPAIQNQNVRGAYAQREEFLLGLETSGEVVFQGIRNDGKLDTLKMYVCPAREARDVRVAGLGGGFMRVEFGNTLNRCVNRIC